MSVFTDTHGRRLSKAEEEEARGCKVVKCPKQASEDPRLTSDMSSQPERGRRQQGGWVSLQQIGTFSAVPSYSSSLIQILLQLFDHVRSLVMAELS